jgi:hypothetical protein
MKRTIVIALAVAVVAILAGCSNPFIHGVGEANSKGPSGSHGTVRLDLGLQDVARSTFKPDLADPFDPSANTELAYYNITIKQGDVVKAGPETVAKAAIAAKTWPLPLGDYTVTVQAGGYGLATDITKVYAISGDIPFTLAAGDATKTVPVSLTPVSDGTGTGTILFAFSYPAGATVTNITLTALPGTTASTLNVPPAMEELSGGVYTHTLSGVGNAYKIPTGGNPGIRAGFYTFAVRLRDSQGRSAGNSAVVHIYAGMTTYVGVPHLTDPDALSEVAPDFDFDASDFAGILVDGVAIPTWGGFTKPDDPDRTDLDESLVLYKDDPAEAANPGDPTRRKTITVSSGDTATVKWYLDGQSVANGIAAYTLDAAALSLGSHTLTITVETPTGGELPNKSWSQHIPLTVEAVRPLVIGPGDNLRTTLEGLTPGTYFFDLTTDVTLDSYGIYLDTPGVNITLQSSNGSKITQPTNNQAFNVNSGVTLTLQNIKLQGANRSNWDTNYGIYVWGGALIMEAGTEIRGFSAYCGAGVIVSSGAFEMKGGVIAGNTATLTSGQGGGGVFIDYGSNTASFVKTGGIIYGNEDSVPAADRNTTKAGDGLGHAVQVYDTVPILPYRDTTVGTGDHLSVTLDGYGEIDDMDGAWKYGAYAPFEPFLVVVNGATDLSDMLDALEDIIDTMQGPGAWGNSDFAFWEAVALAVFDYRTEAGGSFADVVAMLSAVIDAINWAQTTPEERFRDALENATGPNVFTYTLTEDLDITSNYPISVKNGAQITLNGNGHTITQAADTTIFYISYGASLTLENITILGDSDYSDSAIEVLGTLVMEAGAVIRGFNANSGAAVYVDAGHFEMHDGLIAGNTATDFGGGGVHIRGSEASFAKTGGIIYGSDGGADANTAAAGNGHGHAVEVYDANYNTVAYRDSTLGVGDNLSVTLNGGGYTIATQTGDWNDVLLAPANFVSTLNGLTSGTHTYTLTGDVTLTTPIVLNTSGVNIILRGTNPLGENFTVTQGADIVPFTIGSGALTLQNIKLQGDSDYSGGRGVYVGGGTFTMKAGAEIRGFKANGGAGVAVGGGGTFLMQGGVIAGNHATNGNDGYGGGVDITGANATFTKTGGIIYGKYKADGTTPEDSADANTYTNSADPGDNKGHAVMVYAESGSMRYRNNTVTDDLSITLNESGYGFIAQTGDWVVDN